MEIAMEDPEKCRTFEKGHHQRSDDRGSVHSRLAHAGDVVP